MDLALHCSGQWPAYLGPLLEALEELPEIEAAPEGDVVLCPDGMESGPPLEAVGAIVAFVPNTERLHDPAARPAAVEALLLWANRGAVFVTPTPSGADTLREALGLSVERVYSVPLPLDPALTATLRELEAEPDADHRALREIIVLPPINAVSLSAARVLRMVGHDVRLLLADPNLEPLVRPGAQLTSSGLMPGREMVAVADWRECGRAAAAVLMFDGISGLGWTIREALAYGRPVVAPSSPTVHDHLAAVGASAYLFDQAHDVASVSAALDAAIVQARGAALPIAAREAVLSERWSEAAKRLYEVLLNALESPTAHAAPSGASAARVSVTGERLSLCVLNPRASGGGGERFMRQLVGAMATHPSSPRIELVCAVEPNVAFDAGIKDLERAGVAVRIASRAAFAEASAGPMEEAHVVYCSWPHQSDPPRTTTPRAATWHDLNWKHYDVISHEDKLALERQAPLWIAECDVMVHSSLFIRDEMRRYYDLGQTEQQVIPLTAEAPGDPVSAADREHVRRRFGLEGRFLLSPAGMHLHKNYPLLDAALRILRRSGTPVTVVASGVATDRYHGPDLVGLGYVSARELHALYAECDGMVQTSLYEAGSFPMWEAMAAHKPVAISRIPSVEEQIDRLGVVAEVFDPLDADDTAASILRLWRGSAATEPGTLTANARAVAARTWQDVAGEYLELFARMRS